MLDEVEPAGGFEDTPDLAQALVRISDGAQHER